MLVRGVVCDLSSSCVGESSCEEGDSDGVVTVTMKAWCVWSEGDGL